MNPDLPTGSRPADDHPSLRILVVDDEEEILELIGEYLSARSHHTVTAYDGVEAMQLLRTEPFDVVLTDLKMPQLGGLGLIEATASLHRPVAVVVMTAFPTVDSALEAMKAGAYDYLRKPFRLRALHDTILDAAERLEDAREAQRSRHRTRLLELAWDIVSPEDLPRFYGLLTSVARDDCRAAEVALFLADPRGWSAVARGGEVHRLASISPEAVDSYVVLAGTIGAVPVFDPHGVRIGTLAIAGGSPREDTHQLILERLARVAGSVLSRVKSSASDPVALVDHSA